MVVSRRDRLILGLVTIASALTIAAVLYFAGALSSWAT